MGKAAVQVNPALVFAAEELRDRPGGTKQVRRRCGVRGLGPLQTEAQQGSRGSGDRNPDLLTRQAATLPDTRCREATCGQRRGSGLADSKAGGEHRIEAFDFDLSGCRRLLTEDMQHGQLVDGVLIENPFRT